jgi:hypothetical protein
VTAGDSSLLRPQVAPRARVALLAGLLLVAIAAPAAQGAAPAPDPSPPAGRVAPDVYPSVNAPAAAVRPVVRTKPSRAPAAPAHAAQPVPKKVRPKEPTRTAPVEPFRAPDHQAPRLASLARAAVDPASRVSARLALTLGLLVLLSASLVAGAARELAR